MLDYGYFLPGTYWVYEDTVSGAIDSVWVYDAYYEIDTLPEDNPYSLEPGIYDYFQIKTTSSHFNADYYYWANSSRVAAKKYYHLYRERIIPGNSVVENIGFFYTPEVGAKLFNYNSDTLRVENFFLTLILETNTFSEVALMSQNKNVTEDNSESKIYYAKNAGIIIKKIINRNEYWQLKRFSIIQ